jgi:hypothetical protein
MRQDLEIDEWLPAILAESPHLSLLRCDRQSGKSSPTALLKLLRAIDEDSGAGER